MKTLKEFYEKYDEATQTLAPSLKRAPRSRLRIVNTRNHRYHCPITFVHCYLTYGYLGVDSAVNCGEELGLTPHKIRIIMKAADFGHLPTASKNIQQHRKRLDAITERNLS